MWSYEIVTPAAGLAVSLDDVKTYLRIIGTDQDAELTQFIEAATAFAEKYTKRDFINKTYKTFRDSFSDFSVAWSAVEPIEIRRSKLSVVNSVQYLKDTILTTVASSVYYNTSESDFGKILVLDGQQWPLSHVDNRQQAVEIEFVAGFGATEADIPSDLKEAIMAHVGAMNINRGDCTMVASLPDISRSIYNKYRILDFIA